MTQWNDLLLRVSSVDHEKRVVLCEGESFVLNLNAAGAHIDTNVERCLRGLQLSPANCRVGELGIDSPFRVVPLSRAMVVNHHEWRAVRLQNPKRKSVLRDGKAAHACDTDDRSGNRERENCG